jgi:hypothetical protein
LEKFDLVNVKNFGLLRKEKNEKNQNDFFDDVKECEECII